MPNELYKSIGNTQNTQPTPQNPKEQAMQLLKQHGIAVPQGMENDPNALINHVMQSGKFPQNRLSMAQQIMQRMLRR